MEMLMNKLITLFFSLSSPLLFQALVNTVQDATIAYRTILASSMQSSQFCLPASLRLLPLFTLSLLKHVSYLTTISNIISLSLSLSLSLSSLR